MADIMVDDEIEARGSKRDKLRDKMAGKDPKLAELFNEMSPQEKAWGKLVGKLILARSNEQVDDAFTWFKMEMDEEKDLSFTNRALALFHAIASQDMTEATFRILRQMYVRANCR